MRYRTAGPFTEVLSAAAALVVSENGPARVTTALRRGSGRKPTPQSAVGRISPIDVMPSPRVILLDNPAYLVSISAHTAGR